MLHLGDITKISGYDAPVVDVIIGGSPCQDLSVAGKRAGLAGKRSGLYMEQIRIVKEMREADVLRGRTAEFIRPRYMVWENVPGAFSSNGGKDFAAVIEEIIKICEPDADVQVCVQGGWTKSGCYYSADGRWSIAWRVHDAQFWGVPQRRKRISLVADLGGLSAPEILFERKGLHWNSEPGGTERKTTSESFEGSTNHPVQIYDARGNGNGTVAGTMTGDHNNRVTDYTSLVCYGIGNGQANQSFMEERTGALNCMHDQQAACYRQGGFADYVEGEVGTLKASGGDFGGGSENLIRTQYIVRRLTPLECERLQGFPDGWTDIGDWIDSKGKTHKASDSPRYKALGNSIALPYWKVLLKRISAQYDRDATMASLFDGIGGFPYIWERLNGKGSCLWASEIEEFPMAVTKVRFGDVK
jgi:DNA (cytosine-5)-methyltransferase 1